MQAFRLVMLTIAWAAAGAFGGALTSRSCLADDVAVKEPNGNDAGANITAGSDHQIRMLSDVAWESVAADREPEPGSLEARLVASGKVADKFTRLSADEMKRSDLLTKRSRGLAADSEGGRRLAKFAELRQGDWYGQVVDAMFAGDSLAAAFVVFVPRVTQNPKSVEVLYLMRQGDEWRVSFDPEGDLAAKLDVSGSTRLAALEAAVDKRRGELEGVVAQPLTGPIGFHGTWATHHQQISVYLKFMENGEVFMLQQREGSAGYGLFDYHLSGDEIVIENKMFPIRLRRDDKHYWEHDGERVYSLVTNDGKHWFPNLTTSEPIYLKPVYKGDWPVRRPVVPKK